MLTEGQREIIRATVPALQSRGEAITTHFYKTLFEAHPALLNIFNPANQRPGGQAANLATSILMYAANIDHLEKLASMVERIAHKHSSIEVRPEHYPIVGHHLLLSISAVLGDAATEEVLEAWSAAYGDLAKVFIARENQLYQGGAEDPNGWLGFKGFRVIRKVQESRSIVSFYLVPVDYSAVPAFFPGQFISVKVRVPGSPYEQIRQYSLSCDSNGTYYRIGVGREEAGDSPDGFISNFLHDEVRQDDVLQVHMPLGDFVLNESLTGSVVLLSGGVGITPMLSMFEHLVRRSESEVTFIHATRSRSHHAFASEVRQLASARSNVQALIVYDEVSEGDVLGEHHDECGYISAATLLRHVPDLSADFYCCGPVSFLRAMELALDQLGVPRKRQHSEAFAPDPTLLLERNTAVTT